MKGQAENMATTILDQKERSLELSAFSVKLMDLQLSVQNDVIIAKAILESALQKVTAAQTAAESATSATADLLRES